MRKSLLLTFVAMLGSPLSASALEIEPIYDLSCTEIRQRWHDNARTVSDISNNIALLGSLIDDQACEGQDAGLAVTLPRQLIGQIESITPDLDNRDNRTVTTESLSLANATLDYIADWRLRELVGDHYRLLGELNEARESYGEALKSSDGKSNGKDNVSEPPSPGRLRKIHRKMIEVTNIWGQTNATSKEINVKRAGSASDGLAINSRSWAPKKSLIPVKFKFDKTEFSLEGSELMVGISSDLRSTGVKRLRVTGHTDPKGDDKYNLDLSLRRAAKVRDDLIKLGFQGQIEIDGKGEAEPFPFDNASLYSEEQQHAAHRRVEFEVLEK